jgi:predicted  nucleic acid-binding Zn-ribbon protein
VERVADNFGLKIGLEGEKEFKKALTDINRSFKVLGSEMKLVASEFDKNDKSVQALSARNTVLNKEIETQKSKIETLRSALENAATSFGETDRRTQNWQIQLNNAEAALNNMERELSSNNAALEEANSNYDDAEDALDDMNREMNDVTDSADDMGKEIDEAADSAEKSESKFKGLGTTLKSIGIAMGAVAVAAGAAAVKLGKEVISAYADYEQLVGGVDTLFKENSQQLQDYASNAYKTAGLSANDYMETVTSFSASLISSLGGDTEKAVKYADMAITDMSDNANKMGRFRTLIRVSLSRITPCWITLNLVMAVQKVKWSVSLPMLRLSLVLSMMFLLMPMWFLPSMSFKKAWALLVQLLLRQRRLFQGP